MSEKRVLEIKWTPVPGGEYEAAQIIKQSHRDVDFTPDGSRYFHGRAGVVLSSGSSAVGISFTYCDKPDFNHLGYGDPGSVGMIPIKLVSVCKDAVKEYAETNGEGYTAVEEREKKEREAEEQKERCSEMPDCPSFNWALCIKPYCGHCTYVAIAKRDSAEKIADLETQLADEKGKVAEIKRRVKEIKQATEKFAIFCPVVYGRAAQHTTSC